MTLQTVYKNVKVCNCIARAAPFDPHCQRVIDGCPKRKGSNRRKTWEKMEFACQSFNEGIVVLKVVRCIIELGIDWSYVIWWKNMYLLGLISTRKITTNAATSFDTRLSSSSLVILLIVLSMHFRKLFSFLPAIQVAAAVRFTPWWTSSSQTNHTFNWV